MTSLFGHAAEMADSLGLHEESAHWRTLKASCRSWTPTKKMSLLSLRPPLTVNPPSFFPCHGDLPFRHTSIFAQGAGRDSQSAIKRLTDVWDRIGGAAIPITGWKIFKPGALNGDR